jgi:tripartite-type tricarboxylate transporter receptor subunit TctC
MTRLLAAALAFALFAAAAQAQTAEEFYKNHKQLTMVVSSAAGGGYDGYARLAGKYMSKYLPGNPTFVVQNMPGAGGVQAANYLVDIAPRDGTVISIMDRGLPTAALIYGKDSNTKFDALTMSWVGSAMNESGMGVISTKAKGKSVEDAKKMEIVLGASGVESDPAMFARLFNDLLGTKYKVIAAYKGQPETVLAVENGELDGLFMSGWGGATSERIMQMHREGKMDFFVQMSVKADPKVGSTPLVMDILKSDADRQIMQVILGRLEIGRPFVGPPGIPADRLKMLREAFMKAMQDPECVAEGLKSSRVINAMEGAEVEAFIKRMYATPEPMVERIRRIVKIER